MVAMEKKCWGASTTKVPKVSKAKEFYWIVPIVLAEKLKQGHEGYEGLTKLGANGGATTPKPPVVPSMLHCKYYQLVKSFHLYTVANFLLMLKHHKNTKAVPYILK